MWTKTCKCGYDEESHAGDDGIGDICPACRAISCWTVEERCSTCGCEVDTDECEVLCNDCWEEHHTYTAQQWRELKALKAKWKTELEI